MQIDTFQLMPDHIHAILFLQGGKLSLVQLMQKYKSYTTACYRRTPWARKTNGCLWQRGYFEHVVRNDKDLNRVREYIMNNPMQTHIDENDLW
jgi:REP element-mobilizing transposase RayT